MIKVLMMTAIVILTLGCKKETCRLLCHGERSSIATKASSSSSSLHSPCPYLFFFDIITIAIIIITMTKLQCNRLPDHSVLKNNRRLNSRELPFLTCTPAHTGALYICWSPWRKALLVCKLYIVHQEDPPSADSLVNCNWDWGKRKERSLWRSRHDDFYSTLGRNTKLFWNLFLMMERSR